MTGDVIKSFLVGLGFEVDDSSLAKFNKSITTATIRVTALYAAVNAAAAGIVAGISDISEGFEKMGYEYRIIAPAINKALVLRQELLKAYSAAGINITKVVVNSVKLNMSLQKTKFAFEAIYKSVGSRFFETLTKQSDIFRGKIYQNMPKILNALDKFVKFIFKSLDAVTTLGVRLWSILTRVYDFFVMLDKATDGWSTIILGVIAAWKLLNLEFFATPLGMLLAGFVAILALWDDFKTFQEGGESLFDWSYALPIIDAIKRGLDDLKGLLQTFFDVLFGVSRLFHDLANGDFTDFLNTVKTLLMDIVDLFFKIVGFRNGFEGATRFAGAVGEKISGLFNGNTAQNVQAPLGAGAGPLLGSNVNNNQKSISASVVNNINVTGSTDAHATGRGAASETSRVNQDFINNLGKVQ